MGGTCKELDNFCVWIERLLRWVDRTEAPRLPYVGPAHGRLHNPPAEHVEIVYAQRGGIRKMRIGDWVGALPEGCVSLHNVHFGNYSNDDDGAKEAWCLFLDVAGEKEFASLSQAPLANVVPVQDGAMLCEAFERLAERCFAVIGEHGHYLVPDKPSYLPEAAAARSPASGYMVKTALMDVLAILLREGERESGAKHSLPIAVQRAVEFMNSHYAQADITLDDIAQAGGLSVDHFGRLFRQVMELPPMRYLQIIRIERSAFLLRHSALLVEEIARAVGFRDAFYFSRIFRKHTGKSPSELREEAAGN